MRIIVTVFRLLWAMVASAIAAAAVYAIQLLILSVFLDEIFGSASNDLAALVGLIGFFVVAPAFFLGLVFVGAPTWFLARQLGWMSGRSAALVGAVQATLTGALVFFLTIGVEGLVLAIGLPLAGSAGGAMFRILMTDGVKPPPAPPCEAPTP